MQTPSFDTAQNAISTILHRGSTPSMDCFQKYPICHTSLIPRTRASIFRVIHDAPWSRWIKESLEFGDAHLSSIALTALIGVVTLTLLLNAHIDTKASYLYL